MFKKLFDTDRKDILQARLLMIEGKVQREGEVIHVIAKRCRNISKLLGHLTEIKEENQLGQVVSLTDENNSTQNKMKPSSKVIQSEIFPGGRNFK